MATGKTAIKIIMLAMLLLGTAAVCLIAVFGHAKWLAIACGAATSGGLMAAACRGQGKLTTACIAVLCVDLLTVSLLAIGTIPRALTGEEKQVVLAHLEECYGDNRFQILEARSRNESLTGLHNLFQFLTFRWSEYEVRARDGEGCVFAVTGTNEGFGQIVEVNEEYGVVRVVYGLRHLFGGRVEEISARYISLNAEGDYVLVEMRIDYSHITQEEFDEHRERAFFRTVEQSIHQDAYFTAEFVVLAAYYTLEDDEATYYSAGIRDEFTYKNAPARQRGVVERSYYDNAFTVILPEELEASSAPQARHRYGEESPPDHVLATLDGMTGFSFTLLDAVLYPEQVLDCIWSFQQYLAQAGSDCDPLYLYITEAGGIPVGVCEYTARVEGGEIYGILYLLPVGERLLLGTFSCPVYVEEKWVSIARKVIESISTGETPPVWEEAERYGEKNPRELLGGALTMLMAEDRPQTDDVVEDLRMSKSLMTILSGQMVSTLEQADDIDGTGLVPE